MCGLGSRPFHARARFETQDNERTALFSLPWVGLVYFYIVQQE